MLDHFKFSWLPTLAWNLTGFTGLAFCQQSKVNVEKEGKDITQGYGYTHNSMCRLCNYEIMGFTSIQQNIKSSNFCVF